MNIDELKEQLLADAEVRRRIGRRAYEIYLERRGHRDAHPAEDWLRAESEVLPRLVHEMIAHNERAIAAHDGSDPVSHRAAEHMQEEIDLASAGLEERSQDAKATGRGQLAANAATLAATSDADETIPNAAGALSGKPVTKAAAKRPAARKAGEKAGATKPAAKPAAAKPAAKKPAARTAAAKPAAKKPAARKAPAAPKKAE